MLLSRNIVLKFWGLGINVLCIIVGNIRDIYTMQGREGQDWNGSGRGKLRVSCHVAKDKMLNLISCVIFV